VGVKKRPRKGGVKVMGGLKKLGKRLGLSDEGLEVPKKGGLSP